MRMTVRMDSLLDSLLHFSRVGRAALQLEETDLNELLAEAQEMVGSRTDEGQVEFVFPRALPHIQCDRVGVREIFVNLLSNAMKYSDKHVKRVEIGCIEPHKHRAECPQEAFGQTVYYVRDNGIGIQLKYHEQVFKMFKRLHGRDEYGGGTGAGLTIVKKLVERHRGHIWVESIPGEGSTFYFTLSG